MASSRSKKILKAALESTGERLSSPLNEKYAENYNKEVIESIWNGVFDSSRSNSPITFEDLGIEPDLPDKNENLLQDSMSPSRFLEQGSPEKANYMSPKCVIISECQTLSPETEDNITRCEQIPDVSDNFRGLEQVSKAREKETISSNRDIDQQLLPDAQNSLLEVVSPRPDTTDDPEYILQNTPMPSPLNAHRCCYDAFCSQHDCFDNIYTGPSSVATSDHIMSSTANTPSESTIAMKRGKKRLRHEEEWGNVKRKRLKNQGKSYRSKRGLFVQEKYLKPPCSCKFHCFTKISAEDRMKIFNDFWVMGDIDKQRLHLLRLTTKMHKSRTLTRDLKSNQIYTYKYFLPKECSDQGSDEGSEETGQIIRLNVCKVMFLNTFSISERLVRTAWKKFHESTELDSEKRGKHSSHKKIIDDEMIRSVCDHVKSFDPVDPHYVRSSSKKLYLDGSLSISRMFSMYSEWFNPEIYSNKAESLRHYREIVNKNFKLAFHVPKKDQCNICHSFKNLENPTPEQSADHMSHINNKKQARKLKSNDKKEAIGSSGSIICATFDFQKVLTCPHGEISILYYKRKLSSYNFTVFDLASREGTCYMWAETTAKRGSNEVSSCLFHFLKRHIERGVKDFRFWSDNCPGQNRNRIVFNLYRTIAKEFSVTITHRFLECGHTQNEGDSVHSVIERASESKLIYTPEEWKILTRWARVSGHPYEVVDLNQNMVFDFKELLNGKNWTKNINKEVVRWDHIKEVRLSPDDPDKIFYKYDLLCENYFTIIVQKITRRNQDAFFLQDLKPAYESLLPISKEKYKNLMELCDTGIIPEKHVSFFRSLPHN